MPYQGLTAALTIRSAQAFVSLLFEDLKSRVLAFGVWGATSSTGFVYEFKFVRILEDLKDDTDLFLVLDLFSAVFLALLQPGTGFVFPPVLKRHTANYLDLLVHSHC